jgi:predicted Rossmann-fold nucleotide-binding protein
MPLYATGNKWQPAITSTLSTAWPLVIGTLDELFEATTWRQLRLHDRPIGLQNVEGYFDGLIAMVTRMNEEGFVRTEHTNPFVSSENPTHLLYTLLACRL